MCAKPTVVITGCSRQELGIYADFEHAFVHPNIGDIVVTVSNLQFTSDWFDEVKLGLRVNQTAEISTLLHDAEWGVNARNTTLWGHNVFSTIFSDSELSLISNNKVFNYKNLDILIDSKEFFDMRTMQVSELREHAGVICRGDVTLRVTPPDQECEQALRNTLFTKENIGCLQTYLATTSVATKLKSLTKKRT